MIRDHFAVTALAILQDKLTADLQGIWDSLPKPPELSFAQLSDYFYLTFSTLPPKTLAANHFENEIRQLRGRFISDDENNKSLENGYLFEAKYHKIIPAYGHACHMKYAWDSSHNNQFVVVKVYHFRDQGLQSKPILG